MLAQASECPSILRLNTVLLCVYTHSVCPAVSESARYFLNLSHFHSHFLSLQRYILVSSDKLCVSCSPPHFPGIVVRLGGWYVV